MGYQLALEKAWGELEKLGLREPQSVRMLSDEYRIDFESKLVTSVSCNTPVKDFTVIIILHYLVRKTGGLPEITGEWLTFREFSGIEGYYAAFRTRAIQPILNKYGRNPEGIYEVLERFSGKRVSQADVSIVLEVMKGVPILISLWRADEEFVADANIFFDRSINKIFCTEDIVVLAGMVAHAV